MPPESDTPSLSLISGTDSTRIADTAARLVRELTGDDADAFGLDIVRQGESRDSVATVRELIGTLRTPAFLASGKVVWLRDFEGFEKEGAKTSKTPEAKAFRDLCDVLEKGLPKGTVAVLSGPGVDGRKRLHKVCTAHGEVTIFNKPDVSSRGWQEQMRAAVQEAASQRGVRLSREVEDFLIAALGARTERIGSELDKLIAYCGGPEANITVDAAWNICTVEGEQTPWALLDELGKRDLTASLSALAFFLEREKDGGRSGLRYVFQISKLLLDWLKVRVFMHQQRFRNPEALQAGLKRMSPEQKTHFAEQGMGFVKYHPFRALKLAEAACRYQGAELVDGVSLCRDANVACVSSGTDSRLIVEKLICDIVTPPLMRAEAGEPTRR